MKKLKKLLIIILLSLALILLPSKTYADDSDEPECDGPDVVCKYGGIYKGSLGLAGTGIDRDTPVVQSSDGDGGKCKADDICFSGRGMYIYLLKYDKNTKTETVVGKPFLYYTESFLKEQVVIETPAKDAKIDPSDRLYGTLIELTKDGASLGSFKILEWLGLADAPTPQNGCVASLTAGGKKVKYKSEEVIKYGGKGTDDISYKINNQTFTEGQINFKYVSSSILNTSSEENIKALYDYIMKQIDSFAGKDLSELNETFGADIKLEELDKYYIAIEFANRSFESKEKAIKSGISTEAADSTTATLYEPDSIEYEWECNNKHWEGFSRVPKNETSSTEPTTICPNKTHTECYYSQDAPKVCQYGDECNYINGRTCTNEGYVITENTCVCKCTQAYTKGKSCTWGTTDCNNCQTITDKIGEWEQKNCATFSITFDKELYIQTYRGKSVIETARNANNKKLITEISTPISSNECGVGKNCTMEHYQSREGAEITEFTEHFIGPNLSDALVGAPTTSGNKNVNYKYEFGNNQSYTERNGKKYANGVSYWWLLTIVEGQPNGNKCLKTCTENDLKCAEAYCQALIGNESGTDIYDKKRKCIIEDCKVKEPENSCESEKYNSEYLNLRRNTTCGSEQKTYTCAKPDEEETLAYGKNGPITGTSHPTLWCYTDSDETNISLRSFINVSCAESQLVSFVDISAQKLTTGVGIEYSATVKGQKVCTVWFDIERWQLEYASFGEKERLCLKENTIDGYARCPENDEKGPLARDVLKRILNNYNAMANFGSDVKYTDGSIRTKEIMYDTIATMLAKDERGISNTLITWDNLNYQINESGKSIRTTISEELNKESIGGGEYILNDNPDNPKGVTTLKSLGDNSTKGKLFSRNTETEVTAKSFRTVSESEVSFVLDRYCVSQDGKGTITKNDGICYEIQDKAGNRKEVRGQRVYYTSLKSLGNIENYKLSIDQTTAKIPTIKPSLSQEGLNSSRICTDREYIDSCEVTVEEDSDCEPPCDPDSTPETPECSIALYPDSSLVIIDGVYHGSGKIKAKVISKVDLVDDKIATTTIKVTKDKSSVSEEATDEKYITLEDNILEEYEVEGTITTEKGKKVSCTKEFKTSSTFTNDYEDCVISVYKETTDEIVYKITGAITSVPEVFTSKDSTKVKASYINGNYLYTLKTSDLGDSVVVYASVGGISKGCMIPKNITSDSVNCLKWNPNFTKTRAEVSVYCERYQEDENGYNSQNECIDSCWKTGDCPIVTSCDEKGIEPVRAYCKNKFGSGTLDESQCVYACYKNSCDTVDYLYRPINVQDPFPKSPVSTKEQGNRKIGANWVGFERYITDDEDDMSTITGPNANTAVEYVVDLSLDDIRSIRNSTDKENMGGNNSYTDYRATFVVDKQTGDKYLTEYRSSFIHDQYRSLFQNGITSGGQYYMATGDVE